MSKRDPDGWKRRIKRRSFMSIVGTAVLSAVDWLAKLNGVRSLVEWVFSGRPVPAPVVIVTPNEDLPPGTTNMVIDVSNRIARQQWERRYYHPVYHAGVIAPLVTDMSISGA